MYQETEVQKATLEYFKGDELATRVWIKKYALKNQKGDLFEKTPDDMHRRLAKEYARIESNYSNPISEEEIYNLLKNFKYLVPGGSQLSGIDNPYQIISLSNCFVVDSPKDSYGGIMLIDQEQVQIMKRRGGVGHDLSNLRPEGTLANNALLKGGSGSTLYMNRYSNSTREVSQGDRRGALMLSMSIKHPDIDKFIDAKLEQGRVTGANISTRVSDEFIKSVIEDKDFIQTFPINKEFTENCFSDQPFNQLIRITDNYGDFYIKRIKAKRIWDKIAANAWRSAEPGLLFWDRIISESPAGCYGEGWRETSTNPCGEIPLCPYDSCRLLAINLFSYVNNQFEHNSSFNWDLFKDHVRKAQRIMDDLVDLEIEAIIKIISKIISDPEEEEIKRIELNLWNKILDKAIKGRRTGLGITAEGDMLAALGFKYGTKEATKFSTELHKIMAIESYVSSIQLAKERGAFPIWDRELEKNNPFINRIIEELLLKSGGACGYMKEDSLMYDYLKYGRRNIANLTIAPTGSLSTMTQTTSGVEPCIFPYYFRRRKTYDDGRVDFIDEMGDKWEEFAVIHHGLKMWYDKNWYKIWPSHFDLDFHQPIEDLNKEQLKTVYEKSPYYQATSSDLDWRESVRMQGSIQQWIDHSISKTINLPKSATIEDVQELYKLAWESGCKGVTVYRDGSRSGVIVQEKENKDKFQYVSAIKRPKVVQCDIYHKTVLKQDWMILVGLVDGLPYEIFAFKDPENHIFPQKIEKGTITKLKSRTYQLEGILGEKKYTINNFINLMTNDDKSDTRKYSSMLRHGMAPNFIVDQIEEYATIVSFDKVIQRTLRSYVLEDVLEEVCPLCNSKLIREEGCIKCTSCEYSKCG